MGQFVSVDGCKQTVVAQSTMFWHLQAQKPGNTHTFTYICSYIYTVYTARSSQQANKPTTCTTPTKKDLSHVHVCARAGIMWRGATTRNNPPATHGIILTSHHTSCIMHHQRPTQTANFSPTKQQSICGKQSFQETLLHIGWEQSKPINHLNCEDGQLNQECHEVSCCLLLVDHLKL